MSHLQRVYTDYYYRSKKNGNKTTLEKYAYLKKEEYMKMFPMAGLPGANGDFPCKHEGGAPTKKKKRNHTYVRMKRKRKYRKNARNMR